MIELITSGWRTSLQDNGRFGFQHLGIPEAGAMDQQSYRRANQILGNDMHCATLECMLQGPILKFWAATVVCVSGTIEKMYLNDIAVPKDTILTINSGDILKIGQLKAGVFAYLAVAGGFPTQEIFASRSQYLNITSNHKVKRGDKLPVNSLDLTFSQPGHYARIIPLPTSSTIQVIRGPEFDQLNQAKKAILFNHTHQLSSDLNRMGYRFEINKDLAAKEIISAPVIPGTMQLTPSGQLIALMRDAQTTGGYARILQLTPTSINQLAQKRAGSEVIFELID
jgi:biotin-dependent carboxylase-like uncharacterized protein